MAAPTKRIKVVHVVPNAVSSHFYNGLARWHDHNNVEASFYTLGERGPLHDEVMTLGVRAIASEPPIEADAWACFRSLHRWLERERPDVVHAHCFEAALLGSLAARLARRPVIAVTGHHVSGTVLHFRRHGKRRAFLADASTSRWLATHLIAPTDDTQTTWVRDERVPPQRIVVIPYGFDLARFRPDPEARSRYRQELQLGDAVVVGAVARLNWVKDLPLLIRAFAEVHQTLPNTRLVLVGEGVERRPLEGLIGQLGLQQAVTLTGHRYDVPELLSAFDAFVNCSLTECFNQALIEAMAAELPVVATAVGAAPRLFAHAPDRLIRTEDRAALASALRILCNDPAARDRAVQDNRSALAACWTQDRMVRSYEQHYRRWLRH